MMYWHGLATARVGNAIAFDRKTVFLLVLLVMPLG